MHPLLRRVHNPRGRTCGCDPACWCQTTAIGRAVRWWFPARFVGIRHRSGAREGWSPEELAEWKREQDGGA